MSWDDKIKAAVGENSILQKCQVCVFTKAGVYCGATGTTALAKPEADAITAVNAAFTSEAGKDHIRANGVLIGGEKYPLIRDDVHIIVRKGESGVVFVNTKKDYIVVGLTEALKFDQGTLIGLCEKASDWLSK